MAGAVVLFAAISSQAQPESQNCVPQGRVAEVTARLALGRKEPYNDRLHDQLIKARIRFAKEYYEIGAEVRRDGKTLLRLAEISRPAAETVCRIVAEHGWPTESEVKAEGVEAMMFLAAKALPPAQLKLLFPVVSAAKRHNAVGSNGLVAEFIDRIAISEGGRQIFGTQADTRDGFLVLLPLETADAVEERRKKFGLGPLAMYERWLETRYQMPLIHDLAGENGSQPGDRGGLPPGIDALLGNGGVPDANPSGPGEGDEVMVVNTQLVTVDVMASDPASHTVPQLDKKDFRVYENEAGVELTEFKRADEAFDIVLLLDLSGSTSKKVGLIRETTRRFVEMKRPVDRVSVITFSDTQTLVSGFESDNATLLKRVQNIKGEGNTLVWDALKFSLNSFEDRGNARRRAIVVMTDGADNALQYNGNLGSKTGFAELLETVRKDTTAIFPIYLDTETPDPVARRIYADARRTLEMLASQSGGIMYRAKRIEDLNDIYNRVLADVGMIYTLVFSPNNDVRDGSWRRLKVEVPGRPDLRLRHRPGYYAN